MSQTSTETPAESAPVTPERTDRDLQRMALHELVALSTECANLEKQIDQRHADDLAAAENQLTRGLSDNEHRATSVHEEIERRYQERVGQLTAAYESELSSLLGNDEDLRERIENEKARTDEEVRKQYEHQRWLADSLLEGTQAKINKDLRKMEEEVRGNNEEIEALEKESGKVMETYHHQPFHVEGLAAEIGSDPAAAFVRYRDEATAALAALRGLATPKLFAGAWPYLAVMIVSAASGGIAFLLTSTPEMPRWDIIGLATLGGLVVSLGIGALLWMSAKKQVRAAWEPLRIAFDSARDSAKAKLKRQKRIGEEQYIAAVEGRKAEVKAVKEKFAPIAGRAAQKAEAARAEAAEHLARRRKEIEDQRVAAQNEATRWRERKLAEMEEKRKAEEHRVREHHQQQRTGAEACYNKGAEELAKRWQDGLQAIQRPIATSSAPDAASSIPWGDSAWENWTPPKVFPPVLRFGQLGVDLKKITDLVPQKLQLPAAFSVPALLAYPRQSSLLIHHDRAGRAKAIQTLQNVMARLLTSLPAGRVRFTIIDPVALGQNFAGFMHLADHDEALVGARIWTESEHIEQRLLNLTEHMETVIQKYLRNEYENIDQYNAQAGELAEPYRFLVIADFPVNFSDDALRRLNSIASTGARCGVYTLVARDVRQPLPGGAHLDDVEVHSVNLVQQGETFVWKDEVFKQFPLTLDAPPQEEFFTRILDIVGQHAKEAKRVEVAFESIAPPDDKMWSMDTADELKVPIGRMGATRLQYMRLGRGVAQHALIAGKTGSGKSTLLHALVTNLAMWYSPDEVEFYLIDFKKGVEFKTYATYNLPHARAIAVESDREFGLSVLQRIDGELTRRGELYRRAGVQDLSAYRQASGKKMPRTLLMIDEFQEFFSEDDKLAQEAGLLLDRLVRQGRAFGIHVLLGSQTIGGTSGLARSTIGQMAVRVALQTSEADSQLILGDGNAAARLLSRPGEAIYNDAGGLVEGNSPFQVAWLPDEKREIYLKRLRERIDRGDVAYTPHAPAIVFEGNAPADITKNQRLMAILQQGGAKQAASVPLAWLGEPVAIKDPTALAFRRQSGANVLMVGQQEESAVAILSAMMVSLAAQAGAASGSSGCVFHVLDGTPADSPLAGVLARTGAALHQDVRNVEYRGVGDALNEIYQELTRRRDDHEAHVTGRSIYLLINGLQRYRILRKSEESFGFSASDEPKPAQPDKQFAEILRDGPAMGIHTITWVDTPASIDRTLDRNALREFDNRVLFQMSASDSSNLIDSPAGNKLGLNRALAYSEEQGTIEKFRPYALPSAAWLNRVAEALKK